MLKVHLIGKAQFQVDALPVKANESIQISDDARLLSALATLSEGKRVEPWTAVSLATCTLHHLYFMFKFEDVPENISKMLLQTKLTSNWFEAHEIVVASGLFPSWREFIIDGCRASKPFEYRFLACCVFVILKALNLDEQFAMFEQVRLPDNTFTLEPRY